MDLKENVFLPFGLRKEYVRFTLTGCVESTKDYGLWQRFIFNFALQ